MAEKKTIDEFAEGLAILAKYDDAGFGVQPEHDEVFVNVSRAPSPEDQASLLSLGWEIPEGDETQWSKSS